MDNLISSILKDARSSSITTALEIDPRMLVPKPWVREYCYTNECGKYGKHYMCPPLIGSLEETDKRLRDFKRCILLQYSKKLSTNQDFNELESTKTEFHLKILQLENLLSSKGIPSAWGLMGGSCSLCPTCNAETNQPCLYPAQARPSPESMGIDIITLLDKLGIDSQFYVDRITWTGCLLFHDD